MYVSKTGADVVIFRLKFGSEDASHGHIAGQALYVSSLPFYAAVGGDRMATKDNMKSLMESWI